VPGSAAELVAVRRNNFVFITAAVICSIMTWTAPVLSSEVISADTIWEGEHAITGDLVIPEGVTLTISSGSTVLLAGEKGIGEAGTGTPLPRIIVRGHLEVEGDEGSPVILSAADSQGEKGWAGILIDDGNAWLHVARIQGAATAVHVRKGWVKLKKSVLTNNCCGVVIGGAASGIKIESSILTENDYGMLLDDTAVVSILTTTVHGNRKKDIFSSPAGSETGDSIACPCDVSRLDEGTGGQQQAPEQRTK